jgi:hypothetical protein
MIYSETVNAFSLDSLFLSLRINSQSLVVAKPSVDIVIFVSNNSLLFLDDACTISGGVNISAIDLFERLAITSVFIYEANNTLYDITPVTDLTPANNSVVNHYGAVVQDVDPDSPALKTGIEGLEPNLSSVSDPLIIHDIIIAIDGSPIKNSSDFYNYINNKSVDDKVVLTTMHDGVTRNFTITLGEMPSPIYNGILY